MENGPKSARDGTACLTAASIAGRSGSRFRPRPPGAARSGGSCLEFGHFACFVESGQVDELSPAEKSIAGSLGVCDKAAHRSILRPCGNGSAVSSDGSMMKHENDMRAGPAAKNPKPVSRQDRLKQALRENLKRRKSQARGRSDPAPASSHDGEAAPHDDSGNEPGG
jgi:hypothetical protein